MSDPLPENALSSAQVAEALALPPSAISVLVSAGYLKAWLVKPKKYLIDPASVEPFKLLPKFVKPTEFSDHPHAATYVAPQAVDLAEAPAPVVPL